MISVMPPLDMLEHLVASESALKSSQSIPEYKMEDVASFLGPSPAPEVKRALPLIAKLEQKDLRAVLPKAIQYLKGDDLKEADIASLQLKDQGPKFLFAPPVLSLIF